MTVTDLMRHNLTLCEKQMLNLADKAKTTTDADAFIRGAAVYKRIREALK